MLFHGRRSSIKKLKNITANELNSAVQDLNAESKYPHEAVQVTLSRAKEFPILDQVVKTLKKIGNSPDSTPEALARIEGMKIILEALISLLKQRKTANKAVHPTLTRVTSPAVASLLAWVAPRAAVGDLGRSKNI